MRFLISAVVLVMIGGCIDPLKLSVTSSVPLVILGDITDQPGPYTVTIATGQPVDRMVQSAPVNAASVTISDDAGNTEKLAQKSSGEYVTQTLQGVVGRTYTLKVILEDGTTYESAGEKMLPVGEISNLKADFKYPIKDSEDANQPILNGFNVTIDAGFTPEQEGRAIWHWTGIFSFTTNPEQHIQTFGSHNVVPDPLPCSGYVYSNRLVVKKRACTCCDCYHTIFNTVPLVSDTRKVSSFSIKDAEIAFIPADPYLFTNKVFLIVEQRSATQAVYDFWSHVLAADNRSTDLFQTPPVATRGNMSATTPNARQVIGLFSAASVKTDSIVFTRSQIPYVLNTLPVYTGSCLDFYSTYNTTQKPSYY